MTAKNWALLPLAAFVAFQVQANSNELDTIDVVSDNYSPQTSNVSAKGVVKVRQATKMSDVLRGVPGVNVNGGRSVVERYNIRGVSEEYLNISVDGARQEGYSFHHSGNYGIDPEILKRVDIDVGANSVANGAGSLGGAIRFETVDAADMLENGQNIGGKIKYGWGSNGNSHQGTAMLYGRSGDLDLLGYFNYRHHINGKDGNGLKNQNRGHLQNYLFKAKYNIAPDQWFKISTEHYHNTALSCFRANFGMCLGDVPEAGQPGFNRAAHGKATTGIDRTTNTLSYALNPENNQWVNFHANAYQTKTENSSMGSPKSRVTTTGGALSNRSEFNLAATAHNLLVGAEFYRTKAERLDNKLQQTSNSTSVYLEDSVALGNVVITPGVRFDHYKANYVDFNKNYHRISKALGAKYLIGDDFVLFANYTEIFRGPGFGELTLVQSGRYTGNLDATRGNNKEAGFNYAKAEIFGDDSFSITAKYFHTNYDNIAQSVSLNANGRGASVYRNLGEVIVRGVEAQAKYRLGELTTSVSYARARSKQVDNHNYTAFPDAGDRYVFGLSYYLPKAQVELGWNTMLARKVLEHKANGSTLKESYAVSNLYTTWSPAQVKGLELTFGVDNLFNRAYKDQSTQYYTAVDLDPGRNYKLSVSYKF